MMATLLFLGGIILFLAAVLFKGIVLWWAVAQEIF